jgi:uncharacterized pyridoxamine 5'-phosphate oxidase family protein
MAAEVVEFLLATRGFALATLDSEGLPRNRTFSAVAEYEGQVIIGTGGCSRVYPELIQNPAIAISAFSPTSSDWIRIHGKATPIEDLTVKEHFYLKNPTIAHWFSRSDDPNLKVFSVSGEGIIYHSACPEILETKILLK